MRPVQPAYGAVTSHACAQKLPGSVPMPMHLSPGVEQSLSALHGRHCGELIALQISGAVGGQGTNPGSHFFGTQERVAPRTSQVTAPDSTPPSLEPLFARCSTTASQSKPHALQWCTSA